jgi:hypothetical protein
MSVTSDSKGMIILPVLMELTYMSRISQAPLCSTAAMATMVAMVESSSLSPEGTEHHPRRLISDPSFVCPPSTCAELPVPHAVFAPPIFVPTLNV